MLQLPVEEISTTHRRVIADLIASNPTTSLQSIADTLNNSPALSTCPIRITPIILKQLGFSEPEPPAPPQPTPQSDLPPANTTTATLRSELESTHAHLQTRISGILLQDTMDKAALITLETLEKMDAKIRDQLRDSMREESAAYLPEGVIIACLLRLGVPESEIALVRATK